MHPPGHENDEEILEVCLAGQDLMELCLVEYGSSIRRIDLSFNVLVSLRGLHICSDTLEELILDNNLLERVDFRAVFPKLHTLSLNKNRISDLNVLLQELTSRVKNLRHFSLLGNPVCPDQLTNDLAEEKDYQTYRCHVLFHLRNIRFLDHRPVPPSELKESKKLMYAHVKILPSYTPLTTSRQNPPLAIPGPGRNSRSSSSSASNSPRGSQERAGGALTLSSNDLRRSPSAVSRYNSAHSSPTTHNNSLIPIETERGQRLRADGTQSKGRTGKRRFRYVGKNSEGNRFIQDNDL